MVKMVARDSRNLVKNIGSAESHIVAIGWSDIFNLDITDRGPAGRPR